ncbi:putative galacturan 1,4-alpha-galacturonidase C [Venturia inaequalis]|nr:putative galacturan 1,4-alpha-galacturonidase C [Venturia inaequalis]
MDNASAHTKAAIQQLVEAHGCQLLILLPYSPDMNPIELTFTELKKWLRRNGQEMLPQFRQFNELLEYAVEAICRRDAGGHFRKASWRFGDDYEDDIRDRML